MRFHSRAWLCRAGDSWSVIGGPVWDRPLREKRTRLFIRRRGAPPHNLTPAATKALSKRGVPSSRPPPDKRQRKTRGGVRLWARSARRPRPPAILKVNCPAGRNPVRRRAESSRPTRVENLPPHPSRLRRATFPLGGRLWRDGGVIPLKLEITSAAPIPPFCILHGTHDSFLMKFSKSRVAI